MFIQAAGQRLSGPVAAVTAGGVYIHSHPQLLNLKSEESNLSCTDTTKHGIHMCIFHLVSVFSTVLISLSRIVDFCRNLKGVFVSPEIQKGNNRYLQTDQEGVSVLLEKPPCSGHTHMFGCA